MAGKIFVNYRRDDSIGMAGRLHDRLAQTFGRDKLFMDVDHIPAGVDFVAHLNSQVAACEVVLVVIGRNWLRAKDKAGQRRLHQTDDFVAIEIAAALARNIRVIPVLVDGARMPKESELPDSLKPLARRQAVDVRHSHFGHDAEALVKRMREALGEEVPVAREREALGDEKAGPSRWRVRAAIGVAAVAVMLLIVWGWRVNTQHMLTTVEQTVQQREVELKAEWERQAKAAAEAEEKRKAEEAERQRLAAVKAEQERQERVVAEVEAKRERSAVSNQTATLTPGYPSKPVVMIIPFPTGGASDVLGRILAQRMSEILGQPMVVENVPGGGGASGSKRAADAAPDGYQLIFGNIATHAQYQALFKTPLYNAATDFTPVALVADIPMVLITRPSLGTNDLKEFVAYAKANQSTMQYGSGGVGTTSHLACEMLNHRLGIRTKHVPSRGMAPALVDLLANRIDYICDSVVTVKVWAGRAKPIAIMAKDRSKLLPSVPTAREQGLSDLEASYWNAIFLPKGVPADIVSKLHDAAIQAMKTPAVRERFEAMGAEIVAEDRSTPGYLGQFVKGEISKWTATIMASGVTVQ